MWIYKQGKYCICRLSPISLTFVMSTILYSIEDIVSNYKCNWQFTTVSEGCFRCFIVCWKENRQNNPRKTIKKINIFFNWFYCNLSITYFRKPIKSKTCFVSILFIKHNQFGRMYYWWYKIKFWVFLQNFDFLLYFLIKELCDISLIQKKKNFFAKIWKISRERFLFTTHLICS